MIAVPGTPAPDQHQGATIMSDDLLSYAESVAVTEEAIAVDEVGNAETCDELEAAVARVATRLKGTGVTFTADDFWVEVGSVPADKGASSALGPAIRRVQAAGGISRTGDYRLSTRPAAHRKPLPVYIAP